MSSTLWLVIACGVLSIVYAIWAIKSVLAADASELCLRTRTQRVERRLRSAVRQLFKSAVVGHVEGHGVDARLVDRDQVAGCASCRHPCQFSILVRSGIIDTSGRKQPDRCDSSPESPSPSG